MDSKPPAIVVESKSLSDMSGDVLVAERMFTSTKYTWKFNRQYIAAFRAQLEMENRRSELRTEMDSKGSRLILWIEPKQPELVAKGQVLNGK